MDRFKFINDTYGHNAGDLILQQAGSILKSSIRATDEAARLAGDEFGLLLNNCDIEKSKERAGYIRHSLRKIAIIYNGAEINTSASMGFAIVDHQSTVSNRFEQSDKAMYKNKRDRRRTKNKYHVS